jgi:hypothetical protein
MSAFDPKRTWATLQLKEERHLAPSLARTKPRFMKIVRSARRKELRSLFGV